MKKLSALLLVLAILLSLFAGCSAPAEPSEPSEPSVPSEPSYDVITIAEALELCGEPGNVTTERYYIRGTVDSIDNANYGAMTVSDETGTIPVYGTEGYSTMTDRPYAGDEVLLYCILQNYNGTKEVKNAQLIEFKHVDVQIDETQYTEMTIADAREAQTGAKVKVDGVVARITYAFGQIPSGVYLVDETNAIYVYDSDLAQRVQIGNKITIAADKTYWILDSEQENAAKFGYKGCCQLEKAVLLNNDYKTDNAFDKGWIPESTVKQILDTPVTENITTTIFKVTAYVRKVPGSGFTNYYINDLDDKTGSYTYTQCNGNDFTWLDAFDGKICTVYLSAINAKSTASDCFYRFLPVLVIDENFQTSSINAAEHAVKYYGVTQFAASYTGDPSLELQTSVSSAALNFSDATLTYVSDNTSVVSFENKDGKTIMHCKSNGTAKITVSGSHNGKNYSETVTVTVDIPVVNNYANVSTAIGTAVGQSVTVKGIVGPSLVNQKGFYLIDDTGVIAVLTTEDVIATLQVGNEVVITGTRSVKVKDGVTCFGQSYLGDITVDVNNYGSHAYSTAAFITDKTPQEFYDLDETVDYSTSVYILKVTVTSSSGGYSTNYYLNSGSTSISLYSGGGSQYSWLDPFVGQEVTVEVAACNWNSKNFYRGCVLAVYTDSGKVVNELNFTK